MTLRDTITKAESDKKNIDERTGLSKHKKLIESHDCCIKKERVKRVNKLLNQFSQTSNMLNDISVKQY